MSLSIAIVGMACRYPDAANPEELWANVLAGRRSFRRIPPERLRAEDYVSADPDAPDRTYATEAALIEGYEFDRVAFRVAGDAYRSADLAHWLALDVAAQTLADAGFPGGAGLPRETTGVIVGNTLTGEFSRAGLMRLRWPYVRRRVEAALAERTDWTCQERRSFLAHLEEGYKAPFPAGTEETLAGGLSNTIAGRICNYFDLNGGGYTVDGACSSSLLAVATACTALAAGDLDAVLAGGVDLSIDPFELVGFARTRALAPDEMRVYDIRSAGFLPGEGCGMVALMRTDDARAQGRRILATIRGWGISSDGDGGITRPEVEGQLLALRRAYRRAGFGADSVGYYEGHGTGTAVGDAVELEALTRLRRETDPAAPPAVVGSIKANIGHTKAAAGMAGLIKATQALRAQLLPPTTGCETPRPELTRPEAALRTLTQGAPWPADRPLRAGVSAMGFGGINTHLALEAAEGTEGTEGTRRTGLTATERRQIRSAQDAELLLLSADSWSDLQMQAARLATIAPRLSRAELTDLAAHLAHSRSQGPLRAALVASQPAELARQLETLCNLLVEGGHTRHLSPNAGLLLNHVERAPRIGYLFPGQGSPTHADGGAWRRRFETVQTLYERIGLPTIADSIETSFAQPAIVAASLAALRVLDRLGIDAQVAIGHSLGELTALHWAGVWNEAALMRIARVRGRAMSELGAPTGSMCSIAADAAVVQSLPGAGAVSIAGYNSPRQTVISGETQAVDAVATRARALGLRVTPLPVSHSFHSPLVAAAAPVLAEQLRCEPTSMLQRRIISTVTGKELPHKTDVVALLQQQVTAPVRFLQAAAAVASEVDLWLEVGPGQALTGLISAQTSAPAIATDACGNQLRGLLLSIGAAYVLGAELNAPALFEDRYTRPFDPFRKPKFFINPCEQGFTEPQIQENVPPAPEYPNAQRPTPNAPSALDQVRRLVAERTELPLEAILNESRLLSDLHLNSISVGQIAVEAARCLGIAPPVAPTEFANATVQELALALEGMSAGRDGGRETPQTAKLAPAGLSSWVRAFRVELVEREAPRMGRRGTAGEWRIVAPDNHPLATILRQRTDWPAGGGVVVCLPPQPDETHTGLLLAGARAVQDGRGAFVIAQQQGGGAGFARTLCQERPELDVVAVDLPFDHPSAADWLLAEMTGVRGYREAHYAADGVRREPHLQPLPPLSTKHAIPLGPDDVLLITGGGRGIGAECGLALARETGVRLALLGRARPETDPELAHNLERMAAGAQVRYYCADVTDAAAVAAAVRAAEADLGPVTAILHSAGVNTPCLIANLDEAAFARTLAPKLQGAHNLLEAVDPSRLRLFVTFGSVIARVGLPGEADYATANEWLTRLTERLQAERPHCRCLSVEWSVWAGAGMAERMGSVNALLRQGIDAIPVDRGVRMLCDLLRSPVSGAVVVAGRLGDPPTLLSSRPEDLPLRRFLERPRVYVEGVELIADADLSAATDPYLADHVLGGEMLMPGVMGLEAMAQAAQATIGATMIPSIERVEFRQPIVVPADGVMTIRVLALTRESGEVETAIRCAATDFQTDHFRAVCRFAPVSLPTAGQAPEICAPLELEPQRDLYGGLLFHGGRFRRLRSYRVLRATECVAEIAPEEKNDWFGPYLPGALALGDPASHDAAIHAIQACIPHKTLLPVGVDRFIPDARPVDTPRFVRARERSCTDSLFIYDVEVWDETGAVCGLWEGLRLRAMSGGAATITSDWPYPLLVPLIERRLGELAPGAPAVRAALIRSADATIPRQARSDEAIRRALGRTVPIRRRPDGRPELEGCELCVSTAHAGAFTLATVGPNPQGCDLEPIRPRPPLEWRGLLGAERLALASSIAARTGDEADAACTRIWSAYECLLKAGGSPTAPLLLDSVAADGWLTFRSGARTILSGLFRPYECAETLAIAILADPSTNAHRTAAPLADGHP
jgi:enediyne polyketide synthase